MSNHVSRHDKALSKSDKLRSRLHREPVTSDIAINGEKKPGFPFEGELFTSNYKMSKNDRLYLLGLYRGRAP